MRLAGILLIGISMVTGNQYAQICNGIRFGDYSKLSDFIRIDSCFIETHSDSIISKRYIGDYTLTEISQVYDSLFFLNEYDSIFVFGNLDGNKYSIRNLSGLNYSNEFSFNFNRLEAFICREGETVERYSSLGDFGYERFILWVQREESSVNSEHLLYNETIITSIEYFQNGQVKSYKLFTLDGLLKQEEIYNSDGRITSLQFIDDKRRHKIIREEQSLFNYYDARIKH